MSDALIWNLLNRNLFFVKNAVKAVGGSQSKTSDMLDVFDPQTGEVILECREPSLGTLTKLARLFGSGDDRETAFNLVARLPADGPQVLRASCPSATLTTGGPAISIFNQGDQLTGSLKKKSMSVGQKFNFTPDGAGETFDLEFKTKFLGGSGTLFINDRKVAELARDWKADHAENFRKGRYTYAFAIAPEIPARDRIRLTLLAFALTQHRATV